MSHDADDDANGQGVEDGEFKDERKDDGHGQGTDETADSTFAGLAGALWAHYATFISPGDFTLTETILVLLIVVMGGKGTLTGPLVGAIALIVFQESVRFLRLPPEWTKLLGPLQQMIFGLLLVALMVFRPEGIIREKGRER